MENIMIRVLKNGRKRAWIWHRTMGFSRWFPIPLAEAEIMLSTGRAIRTDKEGNPARS
jgi:hypothetical protein